MGTLNMIDYLIIGVLLIKLRLLFEEGKLKMLLYFNNFHSLCVLFTRIETRRSTFFI